MVPLYRYSCGKGICAISGKVLIQNPLAECTRTSANPRLYPSMVQPEETAQQSGFDAPSERYFSRTEPSTEWPMRIVSSSSAPISLFQS